MKQVKNFESKEVIEYLSNQCKREGFRFVEGIMYIDKSNDWRDNFQTLQKEYKKTFCCRDNNTFYAVCFE